MQTKRKSTESRRTTNTSQKAHLHHKLELLLKFDLKIASEVRPDRLLNLLAEETRQILEADRCTVFLHDRKTDELWSKLAQGLEVSTLRFPKDQGLAGHAFTTRKTLNIQDAYTDSRFSREHDSRTGYHTKTVLAMPLLDSRGKEALGVFEVLNKKTGPFTKEDEDLLTILSNHAAVALENAQLYEDLKQAQGETAFRLALMAEHRDQEDTAAHLQRMSAYSALIAEAFGFPPGEVETLRLVAALHDIGKVATPDAILLKTQKLTEAELKVVEYRLAWCEEKLKLSNSPKEKLTEVAQFLEDIRKANKPSSTQMPKELADRIRFIAVRKFIDYDGQEKPLLTDEETEKLTIQRGNLTPQERLETEKHTLNGAKILANADSQLLQLAEKIAMTHHEKYDGTGYPNRLKGEEILIEGRIVALADVFDALSSKRVYKESWDVDEVVSFVKKESGKQFDPKVVDAFLKALPKIQQALKDFISPPSQITGSN